MRNVCCFNLAVEHLIRNSLVLFARWNNYEDASAGNRTQVSSMATRYSTTKPQTQCLVPPLQYTMEIQLTET
jgi:hypothetical protein